LRMIGSVKDSPGELWPAPQKLPILLEFDSGIGFAVESCRMDGSSSSEVMSAPQPPRPGRPSTMELYAPQVAQWLREDPDLPGVEILRRARLAGYRGGKSALYELVRRLRVQRPVSRASSS
jgi:hypothetical protein